MQWQTIDTFPYPTQEMDIESPQYLLYSIKCGVVIGCCYLMDDDIKDLHERYSFRYDRDGFTIHPTHWMPLPPIPNQKLRKT